jgi:hypothetical protein
MVSPGGLGDVIVAAGKEMAGWRYDVVPSWHWKEWGPTIGRIDRDGEVVRGEFRKSLYQSLACLFSWFPGFGGFDQRIMELISAEGSHAFFENLDCSWKSLLLPLQLRRLTWLDAKRTLRLGIKRQSWEVITSRDFLWRKGRLVNKYLPKFVYEDFWIYFWKATKV